MNFKKIEKGFYTTGIKKDIADISKASYILFFMSLLASMWLLCCDWCPLSSYTLSHCCSGYRPKLSTAQIIRKENNIMKKSTLKSSLDDVRNRWKYKIFLIYLPSIATISIPQCFVFLDEYGFIKKKIDKGLIFIKF